MYIYTYFLVIFLRVDWPTSSQSGWLLPSGRPHGDWSACRPHTPIFFYPSHVHAVHFGQLLSAPSLAALEMHIFENNPQNWWPMDLPPHVKFLWLFGGSEVCLLDSATTVSTFLSVCPCWLFRTSPAACWCCSLSNLCSENYVINCRAL